MKCFSDDYTFYKYLVTPQIKSVNKVAYIHTILCLPHVLALGSCDISSFHSRCVSYSGSAKILQIFYSLYSHSGVFEERGNKSRGAGLINPCSELHLYLSRPLATKFICHFVHLAGS